jgi:hypothetical protein
MWSVYNLRLAIGAKMVRSLTDTVLNTAKKIEVVMTNSSERT